MAKKCSKCKRPAVVTDGGKAYCVNCYWFVKKKKKDKK